MNITYSFDKDIDKKKLQGLFLSVEWSSGNYPDQLKLAILNSHKVVTAWDGVELVGLMNCLSDGIMTAYFHYLLIKPEYQSKGIGGKLVSIMLDEYKDFARKILIAYDKEILFYEKCGFKVGDGKSPMFITFLTT